jgi:hypothetical protein
MARIAVDIDSTLYDFDTPAREACLKLYRETGEEPYRIAAYHGSYEWRSYPDLMGVDRWLNAIALVHETDAILGMVPFVGAVETCQALATEGHDLLYISNRAAETYEATDKWLRHWEFPLSDDEHELACVVPPEDKQPYLANCQYMIDDRPKTVVDFIYDYEWRHGMVSVWNDHGDGEPWESFWSRNRRRCFVKAYAYNQALTDVPHLYLAPTWAGLNTYLVSKGVLSAPANIALGV